MPKSIAILDEDHVVGLVHQLMKGDRAAAERAKAVPIGRLGTPEDVAGVIVFLASDAAAFVTGQALGVDGGWW